MFRFGNKILNILLVRLLCIFFSEMSIYKRYPDINGSIYKTKWMYFMIKRIEKQLMNI